MNYRLMTHLVAGYPSNEASYHAALGMASGGAAYLEIQFPFSDPSADGPTIQEACQTALENGWKSRDGWELVRKVASKVSGIPIYIMGYASLVVTPGVATFCAKAKEAGAGGLIIPDLAPGQDEGLGAAAKLNGLEILPVIVPTVTERRLKEMIESGYRRLYVALRSGITGTHTQISDELARFLESLKLLGVESFGGFGIDTHEQVAELSQHVHAAVVGSHLVRALRSLPAGSEPEAYGRAAEIAVRNLLGTAHA